MGFGEKMLSAIGIEHHNKDKGEDNKRSGKLGDIGDAKNDSKNTSEGEVVSENAQKIQKETKSNEQVTPSELPAIDGIEYNEMLDGTAYDPSEMDDLDAMKFEEDMATIASTHSSLSNEELFGTQAKDSDNSVNTVSKKLEEMKSSADLKKDDDVEINQNNEDKKEETSSEEQIATEAVANKEGKEAIKSSDGISQETTPTESETSEEAPVEEMSSDPVTDEDAMTTEEEKEVSSEGSEQPLDNSNENTQGAESIAHESSEAQTDSVDIAAVLAENTETISNEGDAEEEGIGLREEAPREDESQVKEIAVEKAANEDLYEAKKTAKIYQLLGAHADQLINNPDVQESKSGLLRAKILKLTGLMLATSDGGEEAQKVEASKSEETDIEEDKPQENLQPIVEKIAPTNEEATNDDESDDNSISSASFKL